MWVKDGKYARIRTGAIVGQDMGFGKWVDEGEVFRVRFHDFFLSAGNGLTVFPNKNKMPGQKVVSTQNGCFCWRFIL